MKVVRVALSLLLVVAVVSGALSTADDVEGKVHSYTKRLPSRTGVRLTPTKHAPKSYGLMASLKCGVCKYAVNYFLWRFSTPEGTYPGLPRYLTEKCIRLKLDSPNVCRGMVAAMSNETLYVLSKLGLGGEEVCAIVFPTKCHAPNLAWNKRWLVDLPPKPTPAPAPRKSPRRKRDRRPLKALQISDIHVDMLYAEGAEAECDEPLCCRHGSHQLDSNGTRRPVQTPAGRWGTLSKCDIPYRTLEHALEHLSTQRFDYIMWTGDLPAHDDWEQTKPAALGLLQNLTDLMLRHFPDTPVYPSLGNHESFPVNSFPPRYITEPDNSVAWLYDKLAEVWAPWLPRDAVETVRRYGYYTLLHRPGFRIVSLNMNYCNDLNFWTLVDAVDPDHHLRWLVDVLSEAERQGERVHILGHIPPAVVSADCVPVWRNNYYRVVERFADTVVAQFFGHTHTDELELMFADEARDRAFALGYVSPSLTTFIDLHPGYRVYDVTPVTWQIANHHTYIMNLTKADESGAEPEWELLYDARTAYGIPDLGIGSWLALWRSWTQRQLDADAERAFQRYYRNYYKGNPPLAECDERCRWSMTCPIAVGNFTVECA